MYFIYYKFEDKLFNKSEYTICIYFIRSSFGELMLHTYEEHYITEHKSIPCLGVKVLTIDQDLYRSYLISSRI